MRRRVTPADASLEADARAPEPSQKGAGHELELSLHRQSACARRGGFVVVATQTFDADTTGWIAFGVALGILGVTAVAQSGVGGGKARRGLDAIIGLLAVWSAVASMIFHGSSLTWLSLGDAIGFVALAIVGMVAHELSTERVVHSLATVENGSEPSMKAAERTRPPPDEPPSGRRRGVDSHQTFAVAVHAAMDHRQTHDEHR